MPNQNDAHKRNRLLMQYIKYACNLPYFAETTTSPPPPTTTTTNTSTNTSSSSSTKLFHEELLTEWINSLTRKNTPDQIAVKDLIVKNSWFFFELAFKSLGVYLNLKTNCLAKSANQPYKHNLLSHSNQTLQTYCMRQLSARFVSDIERLVKLMIGEIVAVQTGQISRVSQSMRSCSQLHVSFDGLRALEQQTSLMNAWLAFFIQDAFSLIDRGFLFKLVDYYVKETNKAVSSLNLQWKNLHKSASSKQNQLKFCIFNSIRVFNSIQLDFLRVLSAYEHFLALNLPVFPDLIEIIDKSPPKKPPSQNDQQFKTQAKLIVESKEYFHRHYLIGLICRQV